MSQIEEAESSRKSLFDLINQRKVRGATRRATMEFKKNFSEHPEIQKIDFSDTDRGSIIKELAALRIVRADGKYGRMWNSKLTSAINQLIKDRGADFRLIDELRAYNRQKGMEDSNKIMKERLNDPVEGPRLRIRRRVYQKTMRQKLKAKRLQRVASSSTTQGDRSHLDAHDRQSKISQHLFKSEWWKTHNL